MLARTRGAGHVQAVHSFARGRGGSRVGRSACRGVDRAGPFAGAGAARRRWLNRRNADWFRREERFSSLARRSALTYSDYVRNGGDSDKGERP